MTPSLAWGSSSQVGGGDVGWLFFLMFRCSRPSLVAAAGSSHSFAGNELSGRGGWSVPLDGRSPPFGPALWSYCSSICSSITIAIMHTYFG